MDPRRLSKDLEGWWCEGQLDIDELLTQLDSNNSGEHEEEP